VSLTERPSVREASKGLAGLAAEPAFSAVAEAAEPTAVAQFDEDAIAADSPGAAPYSVMKTVPRTCHKL